jgi:polyhydroxybutyrate depolymerase
MVRTLSLLVCLATLAGPARGADFEREFESGGRDREYLLHLPEPNPGHPLPLVVVIHGAGGSGKLVAINTGFSAAADSHGFAVAYPDGTRSRVSALLTLFRGRHFTWNAGDCCGFAKERGIDDVAALRALVEDATRAAPIDSSRVFAAGLSNGGMMAYRLACEAADVFAAVAVVSGALVTHACAPSEPVSVIHIHGALDQVVPYDGGRGAYTTYPTTESAIDFWLGADGCDPTPQVSWPADGVTKRRFPNCRAGTEVELIKLESSRHGWPNEATGWAWEFFASHSKPE